MQYIVIKKRENIKEGEITDENHLFHMNIKEYKSFLIDEDDIQTESAIKKSFSYIITENSDLVTMLYKEGKMIGWCRKMDWECIEDFASSGKYLNFHFGYISGRMSPFFTDKEGFIPSKEQINAYQIWIQSK